jgi:hypothetical protein
MVDAFLKYILWCTVPTSAPRCSAGEFEFKTAILLIFKSFRGKSGNVIYKKLTELLLFWDNEGRIQTRIC